MFSSCSQDDVAVPTPDVVESILEVSFDEDAIFDSETAPMTRAAMPNGRYAVNNKYKLKYVHQKQKTYDGSGGCSWTNYVLATAAIVRAKQEERKEELTYPDKAGGYDNKIQHCFNWCKDRSSTKEGRSLITLIESYCKEQDQDKGNYPIKCELVVFRKADVNYQVVAERMLAHISKNQTPFLFIGAVGETAHYLTCWTIDWEGSPEKSTIYYTDTVYGDVGNANFRSMNLKTFLATTTKGTSNLNFLFLY
jgi:hypothetical protein